MNAAVRVSAALLLGLCLFAGCGAGSAQVAQARAVSELHCRASELRVQAIGELYVLALPDRAVSLFEAHGCDQWQMYACIDADGARCERSIAELPHAPAHPALERALDLLRTTARARCPASELRVEQESQTLFRFESCDGAWLYHCRARGCELLH